MKQSRPVPQRVRPGDRVVFKFKAFAGKRSIIRSVLDMPNAANLRGMEKTTSCWPQALSGKWVGEAFQLGNGFGKEVPAKIIGIMRTVPRLRTQASN